MALSIPIITEYVGTGLDKFTKELAQAETKTQKAGLVIKKAFLPATAAIGGLAAAALDSAKAAMDDEAQQALLASQLRKTTNATDAQIKATEDYIAKQLSLKGYTDSQLRPAFEKLARATGDLTEAQKLTNTAMDIATATGKPLETVVASLEKAYGGNMAAIQRLLPEYRDMIKEGATFDEVMAKVNGTLGGAAAEAATTAEARFRILKEQIGETQEAIGVGLIPVIEAGLPILEDFAKWAQDNPENFKNIAAAIGAIAASVVLLNGAMKASIFFKATGALGGIGVLVAGFAAAYASIESFRVKVNAQYNSWVGMLEGVINTAVRTVNPIIDALNAVSPGDPFARLGLVSIPRLDTRLESQKGSGFEGLNIPQMADGGIIRHSPGGTLALIGEGGRDEAVIPLDRMGGMGGNNVTIHVNGGDPRAVVDALRKYMQTHGAVPIRIGGA
jgi:hypothetical protein